MNYCTGAWRCILVLGKWHRKLKERAQNAHFPTHLEKCHLVGLLNNWGVGVCAFV